MGIFARFRRRSSEASTGEAATTAPTGEASEPEVDETDGGVTAPESGDAVEIPKQQSAEEAADSEAGETARP